MKLLILGYARHGKDTVAEMFINLKFESSSWYIAHLINKDLKYPTVKECFDDRVNKRAFWHDWITNYNTPDASKLCQEILKDNDIYVGMRTYREFVATKYLFDLTIWVDASNRHPREPSSSISIDAACADIIIDNNWDEKQLKNKVNRLIKALQC